MTTQPKLEHTPGPWRIDQSYTYRVLNAEELNVADCDSARVPKLQAQANARLIAAAPELLEALQRILAHEIRPGRKRRNHVDLFEFDTIRIIARAAIAKATGA